MTPLEDIQAALRAAEEDAERRRYLPVAVKFMVSNQVYELLAAEGIPMESFEHPVT